MNSHHHYACTPPQTKDHHTKNDSRQSMLLRIACSSQSADPTIRRRKNDYQTVLIGQLLVLLPHIRLIGHYMLDIPAPKNGVIATNRILKPLRDFLLCFTLLRSLQRMSFPRRRFLHLLRNHDRLIRQVLIEKVSSRRDEPRVQEVRRTVRRTHTHRLDEVLHRRRLDRTQRNLRQNSRGNPTMNSRKLSHSCSSPKESFPMPVWIAADLSGLISVTPR